MKKLALYGAGDLGLGLLELYRCCETAKHTYDDFFYVDDSPNACAPDGAMLVNYEGESVSCHCPTTGRIGSLDISGRPCLLSRSTDPNRKTPFTVEALSLDRPEDEQKSWIGINMGAEDMGIMKSIGAVSSSTIAEIKRIAATI